MNPAAPADPRAALQIVDGALLRHGRPHQILAGAVHYFRVHPDLWHDRLTRVRALGLNTVDTYVAWNFHQPHRETAPRWDGWQDLERFVRTAGEVGLDVMMRPGPYICAEWAGGGLPTFVTDTPGLVPRSSDPSYLRLLAPWLDELLARVAPLQSVHGGPITSVQVENEYGSYGDDGAYLEWLRHGLVDRGIQELLFTADGPTELMLDGGTIPGVWSAATLGSDPAAARALLAQRRPGEPFLCAELWNGWFDHWGEPHHVRSADSVRETVGDIVRHGGSVSLYMAHGGTNFGLWAGANHDGEHLQSTITSYDSDAPIAEHGAITEKGLAVRALLAEHTGDGAQLPPLPDAPAVLRATSVAVTPGAPLLDALGMAAPAVASAAPLTFAALDQTAGLLLHTATPVIPAGEHRIRVLDLHDDAYVYVDGRLLGRVDHHTGREGLPVSGAGRPVRLEVLVEDRGRINYGPLLGQPKGILGGVSIDRRRVLGWQTVPLPIHEWDRPDQWSVASGVARGAHAGSEAPAASEGRSADLESGPGTASATLAVAEPADTFLALPGFGRGFVWVNDVLLGRYDQAGPQVTYYVPAPLLRAGDNRLTVLELEHRGDRIELREHPDLGTPEPYVEMFD